MGWPTFRQSDWCITHTNCNLMTWITNNKRKLVQHLPPRLERSFLTRWFYLWAVHVKISITLCGECNNTSIVVNLSSFNVQLSSISCMSLNHWLYYTPLSVSFARWCPESLPLLVLVILCCSSSNAVFVIPPPCLCLQSVISDMSWEPRPVITSCKSSP